MQQSEGVVGAIQFYENGSNKSQNYSEVLDHTVSSIRFAERHTAALNALLFFFTAEKSPSLFAVERIFPYDLDVHINGVGNPSACFTAPF